MLTLKMTKSNGKIIYKSDSDKLKYKLFVDKLNEGQDLEFFVDVVSKKASIPQITKVHTCIRILAGEAGYTFDEMKSIVKEKAGLYIEGEEDLKSFAHCSKDEITMAIEVCNEIGRNFNIDFTQ
jgi:hypothetical protein